MQCRVEHVVASAGGGEKNRAQLPPSPPAATIASAQAEREGVGLDGVDSREEKKSRSRWAAAAELAAPAAAAAAVGRWPAHPPMAVRLGRRLSSAAREGRESERPSSTHARPPRRAHPFFHSPVAVKKRPAPPIFFARHFHGASQRWSWHRQTERDQMPSFLRTGRLKKKALRAACSALRSTRSSSAGIAPRSALPECSSLRG